MKGDVHSEQYYRFIEAHKDMKNPHDMPCVNGTCQHSNIFHERDRATGLHLCEVADCVCGQVIGK